jgi:iron(III) transport system substrate-binding protein
MVRNPQPASSRRAVLTSHFSFLTFALTLAAFLFVAPACNKQPESSAVTLYSSVDEPFARQVIAEFTKQTGIDVRLKLDSEAGKTTGLVNLIRDQRARPIADVFWSSELFSTIKMAREGLLAEYRPPAEGIPDRYRNPAGRWTAFGLRARVLAFNTDKLKPADVPARWRDMADPRWSGKLAVANPQFGTTRGHFAAMLALWGEDEYGRFLADLDKNLNGRLMDGNSTCAAVVGRGEYILGATDTDDVYARQERKETIDLVYPDMGDGGTLLIPNSVALVTGAPHPETAKKLIDFLASAQAERMLAQSDSRNIPVRESLRKELNLSLPPETHISFDKIADAMDKAIELAGKRLVK